VKIALLFGGESYEHEISIVSAITLKKVLNFELEFIFCDGDRNFYQIPEKSMKATHFSSKEYKKNRKLHLTNGGFFHKTLFGKFDYIKFDYILNLIHGADGEDGKIAGMLDFYNIKYVGPRLEGSILSFNKVLTKSFAKDLNVKVLEYEVFHGNKRDLEKLNFPIILKPARLGSSIGVSIVREKKELDFALDKAYEFDNVVLAEPFIEGIKEYNLAGYRAKDGMRYSIIEAPLKGELLDFEKKYLDFSRSEGAIEANLSKDLVKKIREVFDKIYSPYFEGALIRCDFFIHENEVILNEINPNPGSLAHYLFKDFNFEIESLISNLPKNRKISVSYEYINSIKKAKGKARQG